MQLTNLKNSIPFIILFVLLSLLCREIYSANYMPSKDPLPAFSLPLLNNPDKSLTQHDLKGHVSLINVWASWCSACKYEHSLLMKIKNSYGIPIYGILYRDDASDALKYLNRHGNPYTVIGNDESGDVGMSLEIYGTPETYVVDPNGQIIYRQVGAMSEQLWNVVIYPMVKQYLKKEKK